MTVLFLINGWTQRSQGSWEGRAYGITRSDPAFVSAVTSERTRGQSVMGQEITLTSNTSWRGRRGPGRMVIKKKREELVSRNEK